MRLAAITLAALFASACCVPLSKLVDSRYVVAPSASRYTPPAATHEVTVERAVWHDAKRDRDVPVTIYSPRGAGRAPVVIFSHGIGEDRDSYAYIGKGLAARGYLAVHLTHFGTDKSVLQRGYRYLYSATKDPQNWINRPLDVRFVIDQLASRPDADLDRIAVAGHSAGAFTAFAIAGLQTPSGTLGDPRVKVAVAMSMPRIEMPAGAYSAITIPVLNITGTCDTSLIYRTFPRHRRVPFELASAGAHQYLVTIQRVNHNTFSNAEDPQHERIVAMTAAFLDAYLLGNAEARRWFDDGGLATQRDLAVERK